jgi:8-oxo-dGTP pyrophosphatase MutT (NUDIX family)/N-acetylglutamate synthase-like GNAT family acetyltransferase
VILQTGDLRLRSATPADADVVRTWLTTDVALEMARTTIAVVERELVAIGCVAWTIDIAERLASIEVVIASGARGKGTGAAVVAAVGAKLFAEGVERLVATPGVGDHHAIKTYERAGFHSIRTDGGALVMERQAHAIEPWVWRNGGGQIIPRIADRNPGLAPPWPLAEAGHAVRLDDLVADVRARGAGSPTTFHVENPRYSAVLIALFEGNRGAEVVLTRRSWILSSHRGEVSFPGGRTDPGEHPHITALREAREEIGLHDDDVEIVGELDHIATVVSRSVIVPVVAHLRSRPVVRPMTAEVDRILTVPLVEFLTPGTYRSERWGLDWERVVHFFELDDETVWGATGRMLFQLLSIATRIAPKSDEVKS